MRMRTAAGLLMITNHVLATSAFQEVTKEFGLEGLSGGVASCIDFNNDGWTDLFVDGQLWKNKEGKTFSRVEGAPGGSGVWADFDRDGFLDFFSFGGTLFRSERAKSFSLVEHAIPELPTKVCLGATPGDFDGDGDLDLYVGGYEVWQKALYPDVILSNKGDGTFEQTWQSKFTKPARGIAAADYDEDGDLDLYVSNYRLVANLLWQNDGRGNFADVAGASGTAGDGGLGAWGHTIGSAWGDFDNDGSLDLFVGNFSHPPAYQDRPKFLRNRGPEGQFQFEDQSAGAGLPWQESYASPALADFDNDGLLDLFFTTVYPGNKSVLYRNTGGWKFVEATTEARIDTEKTYQAAWADFDGDGYLDLVSGARLFRNPGGKNHWLRVQVRGSKSVPALGAQVRIKLNGKTLVRQVEGSTGQGNQNDPNLHFGLGPHRGSVTLEIRWADGHRQRMTTNSNQMVTLHYSSKGG
ncbi:MAG: CRTAC1 family protein [Akkermansiaceae bacterium]